MNSKLCTVSTLVKEMQLVLAILSAARGGNSDFETSFLDGRWLSQILGMPNPTN